MSGTGQVRAIDHLASLDESAAPVAINSSSGSDFQQIHSHLSNGRGGVFRHTKENENETHAVGLSVTHLPCDDAQFRVASLR